jgi:polysaccharide biosynthesis transport protein
VSVNVTGYADALRRGWRIVALVVLISVGIALVVSQAQDKRYRSSTRLLVSGSAPGPVDEAAARQRATQRAALFAQLATTNEAVTAAEQAAANTAGMTATGAHVSVAAHAGGAEPFLTITVTADDPDAALAVAVAYPLALPGQLARLNELPPVTGPLLTVVSPPARATHPSSPRPLLDILIGLGLGALLGLAAVALNEALGNRLRDAGRIGQLARGHLLGVVPREYDDDLLAVASQPQSLRAAAYREVWAYLLSAGEPRSFVVTGPGRDEGRSTMAANLALVASSTGKRVAVLDADLSRPALAAIFDVPSEPGLSDVLAGRGTLPDASRVASGSQLTVIPGGRDVDDPDRPLSWPAMADAVRALTAAFDVVIVDAPPALAGADALLLAALTDGLLVVARPGTTTRSSLRATLATVERSPARLLGVVVNAATPDPELTGGGHGARAKRRDARSVAASTDGALVAKPVLERPSPTFTPPRAGSSRRHR